MRTPLTYKPLTDYGLSYGAFLKKVPAWHSMVVRKAAGARDVIEVMNKPTHHLGFHAYYRAVREIAASIFTGFYALPELSAVREPDFLPVKINREAMGGVHQQWPRVLHRHPCRLCLFSNIDDASRLKPVDAATLGEQS